ncbi:mortality factor 4-like protein 1 isoform X2 [Lineus longissimus]|uniref:mortality factor 4-like protein 1 isoform X2 n=1 Tax=Lineus longissimus TaxID=88925 RepID=UPI002B4E3A7C
MAPKPKFQEGEKVLCFHGPLLYEAKCVKSEVKDKVVRYFIHYNGWNKNWDEWVPETRVLKAIEASYLKQKELLKAHASKMKKTKAAAAAAKKADSEKTSRASTPTADSKARKAAKNESQKTSRSSTPTVESKREPKRGTPTIAKKDESAKTSRASTPTVEGRKDAKKAVAAAASSSTPERRPSGAGSKSSRSGTPTIPIALVTPTMTSSQSSTASSVVDKSDAGSTSAEPQRKKRRGDPTVESEESFLTKIEVRVKIPDELRPWLVDDWDMVTRQKQLIALPCKRTVETILDDYVKYKLTKSNNPNKDAITEVTQGIKEYFNVSLGTQLLYKFERPQYGEVLLDQKDTPVSKIYGAMHLLRLFVKLGGMLAYTRLDEKSVQLLLSHVQDFLKYMQKNASSLFSLNDYVVASPEYHRKAIC